MVPGLFAGLWPVDGAKKSCCFRHTKSKKYEGTPGAVGLRGCLVCKREINQAVAWAAAGINCAWKKAAVASTV